MRKPFHRKQTDSWYVKDDSGRFVFLAKTKTEAHEIWREMLRRANTPTDKICVLDLCDEFVDDHTQLLSKIRYAEAVRILSSFAGFVGADVPAIKVTPNKVLEWIRAPKPRQRCKDGKEDDRPPFHWSPTRQRDAAAWVVRVYKWGQATARLSRNPLATLKMPAANHRQGVIDPKVHGELVRSAMASSKSRSFALVLIAAHCGARPQQIREITTAHCSPDFSFAAFDHHKTKQNRQAAGGLL